MFCNKYFENSKYSVTFAKKKLNVQNIRCIKTIRRTDYLNLSVLIEAERCGCLEEQFMSYSKNVGTLGLTTESYCDEILKNCINEEKSKISLDDVVRKEFHTNF